MRIRDSVRLTGAALGTALLVPLLCSAVVYDPAVAFSPTSNPAGLWSYGFSTTLGGPVMLDPEQASDNGISVWRTNIWLGTPAVFHNGTSSTLTNSTGTLVMPPGSLGLHPGPGGQYSVLRFSVPATGAYQLAAAFSGFDTHGTTTDAHILTNGTSVFDTLVNGYGPGSGSNFSGTLMLKAGDSLDFAVGWGANQEFSFDSTGLSAQLTPVSSAPACEPPPAGLVSWWPGNGNPNDVSGSNPGTPVGNVTYAPGEVGQAFSFDGSSYVNVANSSSLNPAASFSLECWVFPPQDAASQEVLIGKWGDNGELSNQRSYALALLPGRLVEFSICDVTNEVNHTFQILDTASGAITLGAWNHLVAVYDQSTGTRRIFVNGAKVAERTDAPTTILDSIAPLTLGGWYRGGGWIQSYFQGQLDEVSFYNRALSPDQVQALYLADSAGKCFNPVPPSINTQPASQTASVGSTVTFSVGASGTQPLSYQWSFNGTNLNGQTANSLVLTNVQFVNAGSYSVVVTNTVGSMNSSNAILTVNPVCQPPVSGLVSWWRAEGNALDSADANNGTLQGNAAYAPGRAGQAFAFDGNADCVNVGTGSNLWLQNFSVEAWVKRASASVISFDGNGNGHVFSVGGFGGMGFLFDSTGIPWLSYLGQWGVNAGAAITDTNWHHVAVTKAGSTVIFYIDGVAYPAPAYDPGFVFGSPAAIGAWIHDGTVVDNTFYGSIDELGFYNRALAANEIQAIYAADGSGKCPNLVPPTITTQPASQLANAGSNVSFGVAASGTQPLRYQWKLNGTNLSGKTISSLTVSNVQLSSAGSYSVLVSNLAGFMLSSNAVLTIPQPGCTPPPVGLVSWWRAEGNPLDSAGTNNGIPSSGVTYGTGEAGQGFVFNGTSGYVRVPTAASLLLPTNGLTLEAWVFPTRSTYQNIMTRWDALSGVSQRCFSFALDPSGRVYLSLSPSAGGTGALSVSSGTGAAPAGQWTHVAATYDGSTMKVYANGALKGSTNYTLGVYPGTNDVIIGSDGPLYFFGGSIDEASVYSRALSAAEIQALYAADGSGKCTANLPTAANLAAATKQNQPMSIATDKLVLLATDPAGHPLTVSGVSAASTNGGGVVLGSGAVTYTPKTNYIGPDRFTYTVSDGFGGNASAYVLVTVRATNLVSANMLPPGPIPGGYQVGFVGLPGYTYSVQRATNVSGPWVIIGTVTTDSAGLGSYTDTNAPPVNAFYRTIYP